MHDARTAQPRPSWRCALPFSPVRAEQQHFFLPFPAIGHCLLFVRNRQQQFAAKVLRRAHQRQRSFNSREQAGAAVHSVLQAGLLSNTLLLFEEGTSRLESCSSPCGAGAGRDLCPMEEMVHATENAGWYVAFNVRAELNNQSRSAQCFLLSVTLLSAGARQARFRPNSRNLVYCWQL